MSRYSMSEPWNDRLEIEGDAREDVQAERERIEGYEACPVEPETDEDVEAYYDHFSGRGSEHPDEQ